MAVTDEPGEILRVGAGAYRIESRFQPYRVMEPDGSTPQGLLTGYYEPVLKGSRSRGKPYLQPVFGPPEDMVTVDLAELYPELKHLRLRGRFAALPVLLAAALSFTAFDARRGRLHTMTACAPYALLGMLFLTDAAGFFAAIACAIGLLYVFAVTLFHVHAASHERRQDAEWIRQLNMSFSDATSAAWEIDFVRKRLIGAPRLEALLGRSVSYADIVDNAFFAAPNDRSLVRAAFSPERGAVRREGRARDGRCAGFSPHLPARRGGQ